MRFSHVFTASMVAPFVAAHADISGAVELKARALITARVPRYAAQRKRNMLEPRQAGPSTRNDPRPQKGNIPYGGAGIRTCKQPGTVAITFDDGPNIYTNQVLDYFAQYGFKATFFVCGDNGHGAIDADSRWISVIRRMDAEGHQVASHTWTHSDLSTITDDQRYDEMVKTEMAIRNILGKYPTYMRPPYSSCTDACQTVMKNLGYVIAYYDLDTEDYAHQDNIQEAKDIFKRVMDETEGGPQSGHRISLAHDLHEQTASSLTPYMLQYLKDQGWKGVTLGECLGEPKENWYRPSEGSTPPPADCSTGGCPVSTNGLCGSQNGATCAGSAFGTCCSRFGYCGSGNDYCGADCNPAFGTCSGSSASPTPTPTPTPSRTATPTSSPTSAPISSNGLCGTQGGATCSGSAFGTCCSQWGYCGSSSDYCGSGCNKAFGTCT